ncbi:MAG TPA: MFS transporter [Chloroflexota bacterium]|nr:MFS transporter [Chloroflexota bacterium]
MSSLHAQAMPRKRFAVVRNRALLTLMLGHFTVDMYVGLLPVLYPLLIQRFALNLQTVGLVSLAYSGVASISQPLFGAIADRFGTRFTGLALIWTATMFSTIGFASSFPMLIALAAAAGLGSGMFHPFGALKARSVIAEGQRNTAMSVYVTAGTIGVALGPLIGAAIFTLLGIHGTILMFLPGICSASWLLYELRHTPDRGRPRARTQAAPAMPVAWLPLVAAIGVMMSRNWTVISIEAFVPSWYKSLGYGPSFYGPLATTVVLASACGTIGSGTLADRYGRRAVILGTLVLSIPCLLLFAQYTGRIAFLTGALVGLLAASTGPLTLVMAQELMAGRVGMASGLLLGLGFVAGAIGVPITGALGDAFGMATAVRLQLIVVIAGMLLVPLLPSEARLRALHEQHAQWRARQAGMSEQPNQ